MRRFRQAAFALWFVLLLLAVRPAAAGPGRWTPFGSAGGDAKAVVVDPTDPSTIWIVSGGTVRKSTDGGVSWRSSSRRLSGPVAFLARDPGRPATLYAAISGSRAGIFRSEDGGDSWIRARNHPDFTFVWSLAVSLSETPGGRGVLWVGTVHSVFRSRDGGATWQEVLGDRTSAEIFISVAPDPLHPGTVYAANLRHRYKTTDGGDSWQELQEIPGEFQPHVNAFAVAPSDPQTLYESGGPLYRSRDGGATWEGPFPYEFDRLAVDPVDPTLVYGGSIRGLFVSRDGAETFQRARGGLPDLDIETTLFYGVGALATSPGRAGLAFAATPRGLFVTEDGGETWRAPVERGLYANPATLFLVDPWNPKRWVVEQLGTLQVTADRGATFAPFATTLPGRRFALAFDPFVPGRVWATSTVEERYRLLVSHDGGASWSRVPGSMPPAEIVAFPAPRVILATGSTGIFRSENLGRTWRQVEDGIVETGDDNPFVAVFRRLVEDPRRPELVYALGGLSRRHESGSPVIYRSADFGRTWAIWRRNGTAIAFDPFHPRATFVAEANRLLVTKNDGGSFRLLSNLTLPSGADLSFVKIVPDRTRPDQLWAATPSGVRRSCDGGRHWEDASDGLPAGGQTQTDLLLQNPGRATQFLAAPASGGLWRADFAE